MKPDDSGVYIPVLAASEHQGGDSENSKRDDEGGRSSSPPPPRLEHAEKGVAVGDSPAARYFTRNLLSVLVLGLGIVLSALVLIAILNSTKAPSPSSSSSSSNNSNSNNKKKVLYRSAAQEADAVTHLPGWSPLPMPSQQYSGFVDANTAGNLKMHYHFVEKEDDGSGAPVEDSPLLLFFNGGPGASSLYGMLVELGPFLLSDSSFEGPAYESTGIPQLLYNEYGWQKVANVLALSMPPPIGFSYCLPVGPSATGNDCGPWSDFTTANVTYHAITQWLERFPSFKKSAMWVSGESYAGVYVPEIVKLIQANQPQNNINLKGFLVGDACTPPAVCGSDPVGPRFGLDFLYGHGAVSTKLYDEIKSVCTASELDHGAITSACSKSVNAITEQAGGYWTYGFYDDCWYENDRRRERARRSLVGTSQGPEPFPYHGPSQARADGRRSDLSSFATSTSSRSSSSSSSIINAAGASLGIPSDRLVDFPNGYQCGGPAAQLEWLGRPEVKKALNIPQEAVFFQSDNGVGFTYTFGETDLISWYKKVVAEENIKIVVYNGDTDPCINSLQAQDWTRKLGFPEVEAWRPWTIDGCQRMGGYVTTYAHGFTFVTIRGSGHMVPQFKPQAALALLSRVLQGAALERFDAEAAGAACAASGR